MRKSIPRFTFHKNKYGRELLVDIVELKNIKKYLIKNPVHILTYYDITFITKGGGYFSIDNQYHKACPCDVFFSKPGEIRNWDINNIIDGYALIFEDEFLTSFFKDTLFVQHLSFFKLEKSSFKLHLPENTCLRMIQLLHTIKEEIDTYKQNDEHVLRALLYEVLMLLNRAYLKTEIEGDSYKDIRNLYTNKFVNLVNQDFKRQHTVQYYADKLCITSNYLNEIISSTLQISAKQYIQKKVIDEAKRLLIYTDLPISDIAFELNYSTVSYFIRVFRQFTMRTPLSYRQAYQP